MNNERRLTSTERAIISQLTEDTGIAMCDSGGAYGRHWERNQGWKFIDEPVTSLSFHEGFIDATHNVFHWLNERVEYDAVMTRKLKNFGRRVMYADAYWPEVMEAFAGEYGGDEESIGSVNTYNGEDLLSQTLRYYHWYNRDTCNEYAAIQIHGGCDVRGGYTAPKVYRVSDSLFDNAHASIYCSLCCARWESEGGYYWSPDDCRLNLSFLDKQQHGTLPLLKDVGERELPPLLNLSEEGYGGTKQDAYKYVMLDTDEFPIALDRVRGNFYVNSDGKGLCPYCLSEILQAGW